MHAARSGRLRVKLLVKEGSPAKKWVPNPECDVHTRDRYLKTRRCASPGPEMPNPLFPQQLRWGFVLPR